MIGFRENEEKYCNFFFALPQKVGKGAHISTILLFKVSQSDRAYFAMDIIP